MLVRFAVAAAMAAQAVSAFKDTSPFFMFSTRSSGSSVNDVKSVDSAENVMDGLTQAFSVDSICREGNLVFVHQPDVLYSDFASAKSAGHLKRRMMKAQEAEGGVSRSVANVHGEVDVAELVKKVEKACGYKVMDLDGTTLPSLEENHPLISVKLPSPAINAKTNADRMWNLETNDVYLETLLDGLRKEAYTVVFTTTPAKGDIPESGHSSHQYEMEEQYPAHLRTEMKRDLSAYPRAMNGSNLNANLPLFEKYQFFNSGIFMGLSVALLLLVILYVALSAISGLEVSYMAFSKEMNPNSQKKQQQ
ncbi:hypothetical protein MBLNU457_g2926t1 [Dothideomycetes sp. NU457]